MRCASRVLTLCAVALFLVPAGTAQTLIEPAVLVPSMTPEVPPVALEPVASVHPFVEELWRWGGGTRTHEVDMPDVEWDRAMLTMRSWPNHPNGDPWDRLLMVSIGGVHDGSKWVELPTEVLRSTTPRADFTLVEDLSEYHSIMRDRATLNVSVSLASWADNGLFADVRIDFYDEPAEGLGDHEYDDVVSAFRWNGLNGAAPKGRAQTVSFGEDTPSRVTMEFFTSGHSPCGEFWYQCNPTAPPRFGIMVDGERVGTVYAMPYVYALLGFSGSFGATVHGPMWWTAQQVMDQAGLTTGNGEVPPYRAEVPISMLGLFSGDRTVEVVRENHAGNWPTSVSFLIDA